MPIVAPLVALDVLVLVLWLIAVALAIAVVMDKLAAILHAVPIAGGYLSDKVHDMAQAITNAAGKLESGIDHLIGAAWHQLARYTDKLWNEVVAHSTVLVNLAQLVGNLVHSVHGLKAVVRALEHAGHGVTAAVKTLEREYHGIEHRVRVLERDIAAGIGNDIRIRIKALERWEKGAEAAISTTIPNAIAGVSGDLTSLKRWLGVHADLSYSDWVKGLVLAGLAALGLKGLNCDNNPLKNKDCNSSVWGDLSQLLGVIATVLAVADFEELVKEMQNAEQEVVNGLNDLFGL